MKKKNIETIYKKNRIISNIFDSIGSRNNFLILGHKNPDEDCISSMVAFSLILSKFSKSVSIYLGGPVHEHFQYLLNICKYNSIEIYYSDDFKDDNIDTIVVCDTPKPDMIDASAAINSLFLRKDILIIEIDHHIGADSEYIGNEGYCLVNEASSACELIGLIGLKLCNRKDLLKLYNISDPFSRNFVLAILSGIIGDTKMGKYLKSKREIKYYQIFSTKYNDILLKETIKESNFSDKNQVYDELERLSKNEGQCFDFINSKKKFSNSIGYVVLDQKTMELLFRECGSDTIISITRAIADILAEESGKLSLIAYYDDPEQSNLIQFRIRRGKNFKNYDVRKILKIFNIENGGGHEGAIGFRIKKDSIMNIYDYVDNLISGVEQEISDIGFSE
ncbi:MAG TPA: DHH family phosphoesterase [Spirochaetota bacterium]|nr:DHH family phosphoesterase [Spirochaetota bacterium]HPS85271.1 DHH family phosphoesterase [Spirochaetota bacterium]